ncbi:hypothetical protein ES708_13057 [subsurface metagenome]
MISDSLYWGLLRRCAPRNDKKGVIASQRRGNLGGGNAFRDCFVANAPRNDRGTTGSFLPT